MKITISGGGCRGGYGHFKFYVNTILAVMWIQQFYKLTHNWNYRKVEHN